MTCNCGSWHAGAACPPAAPSLYLRRAFVVEAMQFTEDNAQQVADWCGGRLDPSYYIEIDRGDDVAIAVLGEYVVHGIHGEYYPISVAHFEAGYAPINRKRP